MTELLTHPSGTDPSDPRRGLGGRLVTAGALLSLAAGIVGSAVVGGVLGRDGSIPVEHGRPVAAAATETAFADGRVRPRVERRLRAAVESVRADASGPMADLVVDDVRTELRNGRVAHRVEVSTRDVTFSTWVFRRTDDARLCEDEGCYEAKATAVNSEWFELPVVERNLQRQRVTEIWMSYADERGPWAASTNVFETELDGWYPDRDEVGALTFALAQALVPAGVGVGH